MGASNFIDISEKEIKQAYSKISKILFAQNIRIQKYTCDKLLINEVKHVHASNRSANIGSTFCLRMSIE